MAAAPNLSNIHPKLRKLARILPAFAKRYGVSVRITSGFRSRASQTYLYRQYQQGKSLYPVAPPGTSDHEKGLALDILSTDTNWLVEVLQANGLHWAGPADSIHFSLVARPAVGSRRTNDLLPVKPPVWLPKSKSPHTFSLESVMARDKKGTLSTLIEFAKGYF